MAREAMDHLQFAPFVRTSRTQSVKHFRNNQSYAVGDAWRILVCKTLKVQEVFDAALRANKLAYIILNLAVLASQNPSSGRDFSRVAAKFHGCFVMNMAKKNGFDSEVLQTVPCATPACVSA